MGNYYFDVHSLQAFEAGIGASASPLRIDRLDESGLTMMGLLEKAIENLDAVINDDKAGTRLSIEGISSDGTGTRPAINVALKSGRFGDPFVVRDESGSTVHNGTSNHDLARPTLLRFEADLEHDRVLFASARSGTHGVFTKFTEMLMTRLREMVDGITFRMEPVTSAEILAKLVDGGSANEFTVIYPDRGTDRANDMVSVVGEGKKVVLRLSHNVKLKRQSLNQAFLKKVVTSAEGRQELVALALPENEANISMTGGHLKLPVKMRDGREKTLSLPLDGDDIIGRLGIKAESEPETDADGYPTTAWLAKEAHKVICDVLGAKDS